MGSVGLFMYSVPLRADMWAVSKKNIVQLFGENYRVHSSHPQKGWELSVLVKWASLAIQTTTLSLLLYIDYHSTCYLWITNFHTINIWELWGHGSHHILCGIHSPKMASNELCFPIFMTSYRPLHIEAGLIDLIFQYNTVEVKSVCTSESLSDCVTGHIFLKKIYIYTWRYYIESIYEEETHWVCVEIEN